MLAPMASPQEFPPVLTAALAAELPGQPDPSLPDQSLTVRTHATDAIGTYESPASGEPTRT